MFRFPAFLCLAVAASLPALASDIPADREAAYRAYLDFQRMIDGGRVVPNWLPDGSTFWYASGGPNDREILKVDPAEDSVEPFFDTAKAARRPR